MSFRGSGYILNVAQRHTSWVDMLYYKPRLDPKDEKIMQTPPPVEKEKKT
jgi:hypothetical protein